MSQQGESSSMVENVLHVRKNFKWEKTLSIGTKFLKVSEREQGFSVGETFVKVSQHVYTQEETFSTGEKFLKVYQHKKFSQSISTREEFLRKRKDN